MQLSDKEITNKLCKLCEQNDCLSRDLIYVMIMMMMMMMITDDIFSSCTGEGA